MSDTEELKDVQMDTDYESWRLDDINWEREAEKKFEKTGAPHAVMEDLKNPTKPPLIIRKQREVCHDDALTEALRAVKQKTADLPWDELMVVDIKKKIALKPRLANDDIKRELAFYEATLSAVRDCALPKLREFDVPIRRPNDFYAEMIKSDDHMSRVKARILWEKKRIGVVEERRRNKRLKGYQKSVKAERMKQKKADEKSTLNAIESWRNDTQRSGQSLQEILKESRQKYLETQKYAGKKKPNMKRILKDLKYGSGRIVKGRLAKQNTAASTDAISRDIARTGQARIAKGHQKAIASQARRHQARKQKIITRLRDDGKQKFKGKPRGPGKRPSKKQRWMAMVKKQK